VQLSDLAVRQGDDAYASEFEPLEQCRHVGLVARQTVESFRYHDIKFLIVGSLDQSLIPGTEASSPADSRIVKGLHQRPVVAADELPAKSNLVVYRRLALAV
jgi:hypothetical protein